MRVCIFIGNIKATGGIGRVASLLANGLVAPYDWGSLCELQKSQ